MAAGNGGGYHAAEAAVPERQKAEGCAATGKSDARLRTSESLTLDPDFERYYRGNWGDEVFEAFWEACQVPLPMVLRVRRQAVSHPVEESAPTPSASSRASPRGARRSEVMDHRECPETVAMVMDFVRKHGLRPIRFLNGGGAAATPKGAQPPACLHAYALDAASYDGEVREFCEDMNRKGFVQFGEAASMLPIVALGLQRGSCVLDLCAAPGNKTVAVSDLVGPTGCVLSNDYNIERTTLTLTRHAGKCRNPGLAVTLWDGTTLADRIPAESFDCVVADVPCSADGTLRKHRKATENFKSTLEYAVCELHATQLELLETALRLCKVGGRISYSTCSLNPVDNECVVASILRRWGRQNASVRLVDLHAPETSALVQAELKSMRGLKRWTIPEDFVVNEEAMDAGNVARRRQALEAVKWRPENEELPLERCVRVMPHLEPDLGGFFVAIFEKVAPVGAEKAGERQKAGEELQAVHSQGYFKRLREKQKWIRQVRDTHCPVHFAPFEGDTMVLGTGRVTGPTKAMKKAAKEKEEREKERLAREGEQAKAAEASAKAAPCAAPTLVGPLEFYGITLEDVAEYVAADGAHSSASSAGEAAPAEGALVAQMTKGHPFPRKVSMTSARLASLFSACRLARRAEEVQGGAAEEPGALAAAAEDVQGTAAEDVEECAGDAAENEAEAEAEAGGGEESQNASSASRGKKASRKKRPEDGMALQFIQVGLTIFKREHPDSYMPKLRCRYRLNQKAVGFLLRYQRHRRVVVRNRDLFVRLLKEREIKVAEWFTLVKAGDFQGWYETCNDEVGSFLFVFDDAAGCHEEAAGTCSAENGRQFGVVGFAQGKGVSLLAEQDDIDEILRKLRAID
eukprot:TRINITY_DN68188_c0_g1_i1.p1 TRINITY_DN68188_c0_g1~~TRINITY_DN68188_c0_g1_i1.p1  ORF type:complete len:860 (+),score=232.72 TRINITY_DN68188_c0_g1_i1:72-2651(+)